MVYLKIISEIRSNLTNILSDLDAPLTDFVVETAKPGFGDITCNVSFLLSKHFKKKPADIAAIISEKYQKFLGGFVSSTEPHPSGYLNFILDDVTVNQIVLPSSIKKNYGSLDIGKNKRIVVEHTSVNPNKALHIGHIRNIVIGDTISRILRKSNYDVNVLNYVDDSGLQVADIIVGFKHCDFSIDAPDGQKFDHYCGDTVYVETTKKYETDKELESKRHDVLKQLEDASSDISKFSKVITRKVLAGQLETCWNMGVRYDCLNFESQIIHSKLWEKIFEKLKSQNYIKFETDGDNKGCWVIPLKDEDDKILVRSNGVATYVAKDIPYASWKLGLIDDPFFYKPYVPEQPDTVLYETTLEENSSKLDFTGDVVLTVIDNRQIRLQKIVSTLMSEFKSEGSYVHLGYDAVTLSADSLKMFGIDVDVQQKIGQKEDASITMSGRKGLYINADKMLEKLQQRVSEETKKRNNSLDESQIESIAKDVAVGTLRYEMIKQDLDKPITFVVKKSLSLEGDTCSYIQYSHARAVRILEKAGISPNFENPFDNLTEKYERELISTIARFDVAVRDAALNYSPKVIARYCHDLAVSFNSFYEHVKVLNVEDSLKNSRLCLVQSFQMTISNALDLLGIPAPHKM